MGFSGSCHCGKISYRCDDRPDRAMVCNCSICRRNGTVLHFTAPDHFALVAAAADIGRYGFYRHIIAHRFCLTCGTSVYAEVSAPDQPPAIAINLRTADLPLETIPTWEFDGAAL